MKSSTTTTKLSQSHKLTSTTTSRASKPHKPPETQSKTRLPNLPKENFNSKTSTQDRTQKVDSPKVQLKDISNIALSESLLCADPKQQDLHNLSGLSIINMLDKDRPDLLQDILNFDLPEENDAAKRELEMKNRLIEKLMKENSSLREEMEGLLSTIDEVKIPSSTHSQDYNTRLLELEHQIVHLEGENRSLREEIQQKDENSAVKEAKIKELELQVQKYYEATKDSLDLFYSKFTEQVQNAIDNSKQKYQDCLKGLDNNSNEKVPEIKIPLERASSASTKSVEIQLDKAAIKKTLICPIERRVSTDDGSGRMAVSARGSMTPKPGLYSKKGFTESNYSSTRVLTTYSTIDENAEIVRDRRKSTMSFRGLASVTSAKNAKKDDENENNMMTPSNKKTGGLKTSLLSTTKATGKMTGRVSMGATIGGGDKKKL